MDNITRRMRIACRIAKATDTHSEYVILIFFHGNSGYAKTPYYVIRTLPVLLNAITVLPTCQCGTPGSLR